MKALHRIHFTLIACLVTVTVWAMDASLPMAQPEEVGLSSERLQRLENAMQAFIDEKQLAGAVTLVARKGKIAHLKAYGMQDIENDKSMQPDSLIRIFSMTKPMTCAGVMILFEEGKFLLQDPISKYLPEFEGIEVFTQVMDNEIKTEKTRSPLTIESLLTHTSGVIGYSAPGGNPTFEKRYNEADLFTNSQTLEQMINKAAGLPLLHQPGETWDYGLGMDVLARLIEVVSGQSVGEFMENRLFNPLGMEDTFYIVPEEKRSKVAVVYSRSDNGLQPSDNTPLFEADSYMTATLQPGGHGLMSTAIDYWRFSQMLLNGGELDGTRVLGKRTVELMTANHLENKTISAEWVDKEGFGFGYGMSVVTNDSQIKPKGTYGWGGYANTVFFIDPQNELIAIFMGQHLPMNSRQEHDYFTNLVYQAIVE